MAIPFEHLKQLYDPKNLDPVLIAELTRNLARSGCDEVRLKIFNCLGIPPWEIEAEKDQDLLDLFSEGKLSVSVKDGKRILLAIGPEAMMNSICTDPTSFLHDKYDKLIIISPETLTTLETRFRANMHMHEGVVWEEVKHSLKLNPEALTSLALMEAAGHEPDVYHDDENDFYFGTCSKEVPQSGRTLNYAESEAQAKTMGVTLMPPNDYKRILQRKDIFDDGFECWLLEHVSENYINVGRIGGRLIGKLFMTSRSVLQFRESTGWRGSLRVKKQTLL